MRIHRSQPESAFTIIPNATLQDQRLSMMARGVLVDLLSRPDGWQTNADAMVEQAHRLRPNAAEGRRVMRAAYAELEALGYMTRVKVRGADGAMRTETDIYDRPQKDDRGTASGMSVATSGNAQTARSHRGTAYRPPVGGTSIERQTTKTEENKEIDAADAASLALNASALSQESDDADASSADALASARTNDRSTKSKKPKPPPLDQCLDAHLAALGPGTIDEMYRDLDNDRTGIVTWATKQARKSLGLGWDADPEDEPGGLFARRVVGLVLMALSKPDGGGLTPTVEGLLGDFDWPDKRAPSARRPLAEPRKQLPRVTYFPARPGIEDSAVHRGLYSDVDALSDEELAAKVAQFREYRPGIWRDSEAAARAQLEGGAKTPSAADVMNLAFKYAIQHYKGRWPMFVVPSAEKRVA